MHRRTLLARLPLLAAPLAAPVIPRAFAADFGGFLAGLRSRAIAKGIPPAIANAALAGMTPNAEVIHADQHQPEFTLTWAQYSARVVTPARIAKGQTKFAAVRNILASIVAQYGVSAEPILGIWGIETNYGGFQGDFQVINALATLAYFRTSTYFANEAIAAMRIAARGDAPLPQLTGSWAGAMGQPQFMPSVYLSTAVSFTGNGRPDIWNSDADALASIANYLRKAGWVAGLPSSEPVLIPGNFNTFLAGRDHRFSLARWQALGVRRLANAKPLPGSTPASLLLPDGPSGAAYLVYGNFLAIRRYNPSDLYALAVGELGGAITA
ncbi:MAG TPA: lytic murein transglycosylase [Acetobacteraceae bacterium]|nr:lytic murein transglycosylase [Acetobacteraceae bacterium]